MNRRQLLQAGVLGTGGVLVSGTAQAEEFERPSRRSDIAPRTEDSEPRNPGLPYRAGEKLQIESHVIFDNEASDASAGIEDWGDIARGIHIREFSIPPNTHLMLGHVQEAGHFGAAVYETLGIALNQVEWRCRVVWRMDWYLPNKLRTYFYWKSYNSDGIQLNTTPEVSAPA